MTVTDNMLEELAKVYSSESYTIPAYLAVGTGLSITSAILTTQTELDDEIGDRNTLTISRDTNVLSFETIRSSVDVVNTAIGDVLTNVGLLSSTSGGTLHTINVLPSLTQTTNFDIEFLTSITIGR